MCTAADGSNHPFIKAASKTRSGIETAVIALIAAGTGVLGVLIVTRKSDPLASRYAGWYGAFVGMLSTLLEVLTSSHIVNQDRE